MSVRSEVTVECDGCGDLSPSYFNAKPGYDGTDKARAAARDEHGWHVGRGAYDICPKCWANGNRIGGKSPDSPSGGDS